MKLLKLNIQLFAHHKGQGSTAKAADGQFVTAGSILYRQRGTKIFPGTNVRRGKDDTLFTTVDGIVNFERLGKKNTQVSVYEVEE